MEKITATERGARDYQNTAAYWAIQARDWLEHGLLDHAAIAQHEAAGYARCAQEQVTNLLRQKR
jgi:hypothetical protein